MKTNHLILAPALLLLFSCNPGLSDKEAEALIVKSKGYPSQVPEMIFRGDALQAKRMLDAGLESAGLVTVLRKKNAIDANVPWVSFTASAAKYLMPTGAEDLQYHRQNVKIADEHFKEIDEIEISKSGKAARVVYYTSHKHPTPFAMLFIKDISEPVKKTAYLIRDKSGWRVKDKLISP